MDTTYGWQARLPSLTSPAERRVAEFLFRVGPGAAVLTAKEIAAGAGTSDATVVRTARSLGFDNLRALRQAVGGSAEPDLSSRLRATVGGGRGGHDLLQDAVVRQVDILEAMLRRISPAEFDEACRLLGKASSVWWSGTGPSASVADYAAFLCRRHGVRGGALTHAGTDHADELLSVRGDDVVVLLAYGRIHRYVEVLLAHAEDVGAEVVLISDVLGPRLRGPIAVRLDAGRGTPALFASHAQTMVLVESLVTGVAGSHMDRSEAALGSLNTLRHGLAGVPIDVDPS